jgi:hypothetical protein
MVPPEISGNPQMFDLLRVDEELFVVENPSERAQNEDVGHCPIVKTHETLAGMETLLTLIITIVLIILIWLLAPLYL